MKSIVIGVIPFLILTVRLDAQPRYAIANDGKADGPVVVAKNANERTRQAAQTLADYLGKITDAKFDVKIGDGATGLVVGLARDFPGIASPKEMQAKDPTRSEDYW